MKKFAVALLALCALPPLRAAPEKHSAVPKPYILYAQFQQETPVTLSDGTDWVMDSGDCFPVYMFKEHQTKVVLQLGGATFLVDASSLHVLKDNEAPAALLSYRKTLENYLKARSEHWKQEAQGH